MATKNSTKKGQDMISACGGIKVNLIEDIKPAAKQKPKAKGSKKTK